MHAWQFNKYDFSPDLESRVQKMSVESELKVNTKRENSKNSRKRASLPSDKFTPFVYTQGWIKVHTNRTLGLGPTGWKDLGSIPK